MIERLARENRWGRLTGLVAAVLVAALPANAATAPPDTAPATVAACLAAADATVPASDRPTAAQSKALAGCDAEALYYGIGRPADPVQARLCAFTQMASQDHDTDAGFSGGDMLMAIYANGLGAARNLPYAIRLVCTGSAAPAEYDGRVANLLGKQRAHWTGSDFSWCDDITSGFASGACAAHQQRISQLADKAALDALAKRYTGAAGTAFGHLRSAQAAWSTARGEQEIDLSGSARGSFIVDEEQLQDKDFREMLKRLQSGPLPRLGSADLEAADARMNAVYARIQAQKGDTLQSGTVTKAQVRQVQRLWLRYRDAWGSFAAAAYPQWGSDAAEAWITKKRADMLSAFLDP